LNIPIPRPTTDERLLAALSHASILFVGLGLAAPVIIWASNREKSPYVRFQSLQALGYQVFMSLVYLLLTLVMTIAVFVLLFFMIGLAIALESEALMILATLSQFLIFFGIFGIMGLYILGGLIAGAFCLAGKPFRYPVYGPWLERFLNAQVDPRTEVTHE